MVSLADAALVLAPAVSPPAVVGPGGDIVVTVDAAGNAALAYWAPRLGARPTAQQLGAVTDAQVMACYAARAAAAAKAHVDNPTADPVVLTAGGADVAMLTNINEVRAAVNELKARWNAFAAGGAAAPVTFADLAIVDPLAAQPYVKGGIDALAGQ